jgi:hypothetical protein
MKKQSVQVSDSLPRVVKYFLNGTSPSDMLSQAGPAWCRRDFIAEYSQGGML